MSETLKRQLADALAAYQQDDLLRLDGLVDEIEALGPAYRFHASLLCAALKRKDQTEAAIAALLHPLHPAYLHGLANRLPERLSMLNYVNALAAHRG